MGDPVLLADDAVLRVLGRIALGKQSDVLARQWRSDVHSRAAGTEWTEDGDLAINFLFGCYFLMFAGLLILLLAMGYPGSQHPLVEVVASVLVAIPGGLAILHGVAMRVPGQLLMTHLGATFVGCAAPAFVMTLALLHQG